MINTKILNVFLWQKGWLLQRRILKYIFCKLYCKLMCNAEYNKDYMDCLQVDVVFLYSM